MRHTDKQPLPDDFLSDLQQLQKAYLAHSDPIKQSGFHGGEARWRTERGVILNAVSEDGDLLDVGCANGYLLECLVEWAKEMGITINPYGVDQGASLIELARGRLAKHENQFWVGNSWDWIPPRKFHYVYTLVHNVPEPLIGEYILRLLQHYVATDGILIVGAYGSTSRNEPAMNVADVLTGIGLPVVGQAVCGELPVTHVAWTRHN